MNNYISKTYDFDSSLDRLMEAFAGERNLFLLESSLFEKDRGRFSYLGFDPFHIVKDNREDILSFLKKEFSLYSNEPCPGEELFPSGIVGFLGYNYALKQENIIQSRQSSLGCPDSWFGFYDCVLAVDHFQKKLRVYSSGLPEKNSLLRKQRAKDRLEYIERKMEYFDGTRPWIRPLEDGVQPEVKDYPFESNFTPEEYKEAVVKILRYIKSGDAYQVNLSQRFTLDILLDQQKILRLYRTLQQLSPSCFGGFLDCGEFQILSSSPERFLKIEKGRVQARPMKGTRSRGGSSQEDQLLKNEILFSEKDEAELLMITDLMRNDLGRVCQYGSIRVKELRAIEQYQTVFQTTSSIEGVLAEDKDCFDALRACFPGGSVTGCPKIRAMQIIEQLETVSRDIYTGCLGYISFSGNADFNILIRTLLALHNKISFHAGGGVVADSTPEGEYKESLIKAKAMMTAAARAMSCSTARA